MKAIENKDIRFQEKIVTDVVLARILKNLLGNPKEIIHLDGEQEHDLKKGDTVFYNEQFYRIKQDCKMILPEVPKCKKLILGGGGEIEEIKKKLM